MKLKMIVTFILVLMCLHFLATIPHVLGGLEYWHLVCESIVIYFNSWEITKWIFKKEET